MARRKGKSKAKAKTAPKASNTLASRPSHSHRGMPSSPHALAQAREAVMAQFSLRDEARYMQGHRSMAFDSSKKLRHMPIAFVSAGSLEGTIPERIPSVEQAASPRVDAEALAQMTIRSHSPTPSVSSASSDGTSEDIVVFRGRGHTPLTQSTPQVHSAPLAPSASTAAPRSAPEQHAPSDISGSSTPQLTGASSDDQTSLPIEAVASAAAEQTGSHQAQKPSLATGHDSDIDSNTNSVIPQMFEKRRRGKPIWEGKTTEWVSRSKPGIGWLPVQDRPDMTAFLRGEEKPEDAALNDYMQNVVEFGVKDEMVASSNFARREMDLDAGSFNNRAPDSDPHGDDDEWNSDLLRDLDGLSTSSDVMDTVTRILNKRTRTSGIQYLVVYEGYTPDDARWLPASFLTTPAEQGLVREFEGRLCSRPRPISSDGDTSDSELDVDLDEAAEEDSDDDDEELDDEIIARVLQKQEELGLGSDEVLLHAADDYFDRPLRAQAHSVAFDRPNRKRQHRVGGGKRSEPTFPSASAMADALAMDPYNGFDIMDTERPSLRLRKKGRRGQMPPELEDADLGEQLQTTWENDRAKKRLKKAEREELRKQGLLGRKGKGADLDVKYKDGVDMMEVVEEIREFMISDRQTLALPAMEAYRRAMIHQFVGQLGVSSKSRGDGMDRFTVLSKTRRTMTFNYDEFEAALEKKKLKSRLQHAFPPQGKQKGRVGTKNQPIVSYKDGEVVGASAPELGPENKGRALLEKMGWSRGMGLGALDNKGILHPISHTVKTNKAGLQ